MKSLIFRIAYYPWVNKIVRNILFPFSKINGKRLISVSGKILIKTSEFRFSLHTNQTCSVTQELFYKGAENYEFTGIFAHLIKNNKVFFDIGANIGYFSILAGVLNPRVQTFAFEPSLGAIYYLRKNIEENKLTANVSVIEEAVSNENGTLTFHVVTNPKYPWIKHNLNGSNSLQNQHGKKKTQSYAVKATTLEKVMKENNLQQIDIIKIDTECTEHYILESSLKIINQFRPVIICEVYDVIQQEVQNVIDKFNNYLIYEIIQNKLFPIYKLNQSSKKEFNFIFCPVEKTDQLQKFISS